MNTLADEVGGPKRIIGGPFGSKLTTKDYTEAGIPVIRGSNMECGGRWIGGDFAYVSNEKFERDLSTNVARPGSIIVTQRGTLGQVSIIPDDSLIQNYVVSQSQMAIEVDRRKACRDFVYYYLRSPQFKEHSEQQTIQTGVPHINLGILRSAPALFPPLADQRTIASTLGLLDDKIELNRKTAVTLETMARALYRSWFVDFDAVRARAEGRAPAHMDTATAALFPNSFGEDGLPVGWEASTIGDVAEIVGGSTPSTKEDRYWEGGHHVWATPKDLSNLRQVFLFETERRVTSAGLSKITSGLSPAGTLLLSSRAPIGYLALTTMPVAVNQGFIAIRETRWISGIEAYYWCAENMDAIHANANGSTFQEISKKNFRPLTYVLAPEPVRDAFNKQAGLWFAKMKSLLSETRTLANLRDTLLPRLMSGELRVGAARELVEEVA